MTSYFFCVRFFLMRNSQGQVSVIKSLNLALHLFEAPCKYIDPLQAELPFVFFTEEKKRLCPVASSLWGRCSPNFLRSHLFFSFSNYFPSTSIRLMVNRVCYRRARCSKHTAIRPGFKYISNLRACSTKILLDSSTVFLEYTKIEQAKEGFCWQGDRLMNRIKLILSKLKKSSEKIIYLNW